VSQTLLGQAAEAGHAGLAKMLLEKGVDVEAKDGLGYTPLCWARMAGNAEAVKLLLKRGARAQL
jgi:ankyrin repeat protein